MADPDSIPAPVRLGFGRAIPEDRGSALLSDPEHWQPTADGGQRLVVHMSSPGARELRLGLAIDALPEGASLSVFSPQSADLAPISGAEVLASLEHDRAAPSSAKTSPTDEPLFWTPLTLGETVSLELTLPAGMAPDALVIRPVRLSHLFRLPFTTAGKQSQGPNDCHRDVACSDDPLVQRLARATAILLYTLAEGGSNTCSGVLLVDGDPKTRIPYLVTAHHCIPDQARASSLETYWGHRAEGCREEPRRQPVRVTGGAELLYARKCLDTAFLRLHRDPPEEAVFADWSTALPATDTAILSVHYPFGKTAKMARGRLTHYWHCADVAYCGADAEPDSIDYFGVTWSAGLTSGSSSGAGAFHADTGELVGVLTGGLSHCEAPSGPDDFGRFDRAYRAELWRWLGP